MMKQRNVLLLFIIFICLLFAYVDLTRSCSRERGAGKGGAGEEVQDYSSATSIR